MNKHIPILFFLVFSLPLYPQGPEWNVYTTSNSGLPSNTVYSIAFENNRIWLGTDKGLARFESGTWTIYDTSNSDIPGNIIRVVKVNKDGLKLVGSHNSGIALFDDFTWTIYDTSNSPLPFNVIFDADFDKENIWIATPFGVAKTNGEKWEIFNSSNVDSLNIPLRIECDPYSNNVWIGAQTKGLFLFDGKTWTRYSRFNSGLSNGNVRALSLDEFGNTWIGMDYGGLDKYNLNNNTWTNYFSGFVSSIAIDSSNVKWLGTGGGVFKFENGAVSKNFTSVNSPLPNDNVNVVNVANNQNIWIGTSGGAAVYNENGIVNIENLSLNIPQDFELFQNYPNPFNPTTTISFNILKEGPVKLKVFDITGREISTLVNESKQPGKYSLDLNGINLSSGVYFYKIEAGSFIETKRMVLVK